ncbi:MAG: hypothetical protein WBS33_19720 [Verrucomicrobiia bacterium]
MKRTPFILLLMAAVKLHALDRFAALSMIESGDNDRAHGRDGELSRYQFSPGIIAEFQIDAARLNDPAYARQQATRVMNSRCSGFEHHFHRAPTDVEFYLLWHRPNHVEHPTGLELERAQRFANLVNRPDARDAKP